LLIYNDLCLFSEIRKIQNIIPHHFVIEFLIHSMMLCGWQLLLCVRVFTLIPHSSRTYFSKIKMFVTGILNIHIKFEIERDIKNISNIFFCFAFFPRRAMFVIWGRKAHTYTQKLTIFFILCFSSHSRYFFM
jgi:hypothetical protein